MYEVKLLNISAMTGVDIKYQLMSQGLVMDQDFTWEFHQALYETDSNQAVPQHAIFKFRDAATATYYRLKWIG